MSLCNFFTIRIAVPRRNHIAEESPSDPVESATPSTLQHTRRTFIMCYLKTWYKDCGWTGFQPYPRGCAFRFLGVEPCPSIYGLITQTGPCGECPKCQPQLYTSRSGAGSGETDEAEYDADLDSDDPKASKQAVSLARLPMGLYANYLKQPYKDAATQTAQGKQQTSNAQDGVTSQKRTATGDEEVGERAAKRQKIVTLSIPALRRS